MNKKIEENAIYYYTKGDEKMLPESGNNYNMNKESRRFHNDFIKVINSWDRNSDEFLGITRIGINKKIEELSFKKKRKKKTKIVILKS